MAHREMTQPERIRRYSDMIAKQVGKAVRPFRADGYVNMVNKYGTQKDVSEQYQYQPEMMVPDQNITAFYESDGLFARVIDAPAEEAIKHGFELKGIANSEIEDFCNSALEELDWDNIAMTCIKWTRLFGGAIAVLLVDDDRGLEEPLDWKNVKSVDDIRVFDRSIVQPDYNSMYNYDPSTPYSARGSRWGMPEYYRVFSRFGSFTVHESRCLVFQNGVLPENTTNSTYQFWGVPEYIRVNKSVRDAELAHRSAPKLLDRSVQAIYKMKDLAMELATEEGEMRVLKRLEAIDMARGYMNSIVIDSEGEDYDFRSFSFSGVNDVVSTSCNMLSAVSNIPQVILFGQAVGGLSTTDDTGMENWYSYVGRIQKRMLKPNLRYLLSIILQAGVTSGEISNENEEIPKIDIEFKPLWSMTEAEQLSVEAQKLQLQATKASTLQAYVEMQVIDPMEIRRALASPDELDIDTILDDLTEEEIEAGVQSQQQGEEGGIGDMGAMMGEGVLEGGGEAPEQPEAQQQQQTPVAPQNAPEQPQQAPQEQQKPSEKEKEPPKKTEEDSTESNYGAVGVLVVKDGKILTGKRHNTSGYGLICGPGGHIDKGETPEQAAIREAQEEFGITPKELIPLGQGMEEESGLKPHLFLCMEYDGTPQVTDLEITEHKFRSLTELAKMRNDLFEPFADSLFVLSNLMQKFLSTDGLFKSDLDEIEENTENYKKGKEIHENTLQFGSEYGIINHGQRSVRHDYSEDQERDERGRFADEGKGTTGSDKTASSKKRERQSKKSSGSRSNKSSGKKTATTNTKSETITTSTPKQAETSTPATKSEVASAIQNVATANTPVDNSESNQQKNGATESNKQTSEVDPASTVSATGVNIFKRGFSERQLDSHFARHTSEYPGLTKEEYNQQGHTLIQKACDGKNIFGYKLPSGAVVRYDVTTNDFAVGYPSTGLATFHKWRGGLKRFYKIMKRDGGITSD